MADFKKVGGVAEDVYTLDINAPTALSLSVIIEDLVMPAGAVLAVLGSGISVSPSGDDLNAGWYRTPVLAGDALVLKVTVPKGSSEPSLRLARVLVGLRDISAQSGAVHPELKAFEVKAAAAAAKASGSGNGGSGVPSNFSEPEACVRNFACFKDGRTSDIGDSAVQIRTAVGTACSGTLIMNTARDFRPIISTAEHCFRDGTEADVSRTQVSWKNEEPCGSRAFFVPTNRYLTNGVKQHIRDKDLDVVFLESNLPPPTGSNPYWVGFDASEEGMTCETFSESGQSVRACSLPGSEVVGIHHARGFARSLYEGSGVMSSDAGYLPGRTLVGGWRLVLNEATEGASRPGSSGGGVLFNGRIVGVTLGGGGEGDSSCQDTGTPGRDVMLGLRFMDLFGAHKQLLPAVRDLLDPINSGRLKIDGGRNPAREFAPVFVVTGPSEIREGAIESFTIGGASSGDCTVSSSLGNFAAARFKVGDQFTVTGTAVGVFPVSVRCVSEGGQSSEVVKSVTVTKGSSSGGSSASGGGSFGLAMSVLMGVFGLSRRRFA